MKHTKKVSFLLLFTVCILSVLSACAKRTDVKPEDGYIYCLNADRTGLLKISFDIPEGEAEEKAEAVLEELAAQPEDIEYVQAIPEQVQVQGVKIEKSFIYVDFSAAYLELPTMEEKLTRAAVVQSLLLISGINGVWFTVDGENLKDSSGKMIGLMTADDFVVNAGAPSSYETATLTLYFANETGDMLVEEKMDVKYSSNISKEKLIVEKLMNGPKKSGSNPTINPNATLLSVTIKDEVCYVNFDSEFLVSAYDIKPEVMIYSLVNSLIEGTQAEKVQITVNGEKNVTYLETIDLSQPMQQNLDLVEGKEEG